MVFNVIFSDEATEIFQSIGQQLQDGGVKRKLMNLESVLIK